MRHLGDVTGVRGAEVEPVDVVAGGSPCQDLSVAGQRNGLAGERSGLFREQIRIIKELRDADRKRGRTDELIRPRYAIWENVVGAFSSNGGRDFQTVLTEFIRVAEPGAPEVPLPDKGKWPGWDVYLGDGWSVAYRVHDAQYWGVPQRRRRICVLADYGGWTAGDILLDPLLRGEAPEDGENGAVADIGAVAGPEVQPFRESLPRNFEPRRTPGESHAGDSGEGAAEAGGMSREEIVTYPEIAHTLSARHDGSPQPDKGNGANFVCYSIQGNTIDRDAKQNGIGISENIAHTLDAVDRHAVGPIPQDGASCAGFKHMASGTANGIGYEEEKAPTLIAGQESAVVVFAQNQRNEVRDLKGIAGSLAAEPGMKQQTYVFDARGNGDQTNSVLAFAQNQLGEVRTSKVSGTLNTNSNATGRNAPLVFDARGNGDGNVCCTLTGDHQDRVTDYTAICVGNGQCAAVDCRNGKEDPEINGTLQAKSTGGMSLNLQNVCRCGSVVRRLTPTECERLQGYPDGWTNLGEWTDSKGKRRRDADSPRYRALGNSIALPFWQWLARRIAAQYVGTPTLGSLFDGIGGFPLVWTRATGSAKNVRWSSEIEEFPLAVLRRRFGDEDAGTDGDWREFL